MGQPLNGYLPRLLEWREVGGPLVGAPDTSGYGMSTIRDLVPYEFGVQSILYLLPKACDAVWNFRLFGWATIASQRSPRMVQCEPEKHDFETERSIPIISAYDQFGERVPSG